MSNQKLLFNVRLDPDLRRKLEELAQLSDRTSSAYVRYLIRREWDARHAAPQSPNSTPSQCQ